MKEALSLDTPEGVDYTLHPEATSCWITVDNISVYIVRTDEGVVVDLYPKGREAEDPALAGTYAFFTEAEDDYEHEDRDVGRGQEINRDLPGT